MTWRFTVRRTGIEPVSHPWQGRILPLNQHRMCCVYISTSACTYQILRDSVTDILLILRKRAQTKP